MQLKYFLGLLLAGTLTFGRSAAEQSDPELELHVEGRIEIGPNGRVIEYNIDEDEVSDAVRSLIATAVGRWRFEPIMEDGRAVIGVTDMRLQLTAVPVEQDYRLRVDSVAFGPTSDTLVPPRYPRRLVRENVGGKVILVAQVKPDGRVARVHVQRVDLSREGREQETARWRKVLGDAAAEAARQWSFEGFEVVDGDRRGSNVRIPITFSSGEGWIELYRGPSTPTPWLDTPQLATTGDEAGDSLDMTPLDSRFRLQAEVVGTML